VTGSHEHVVSVKHTGSRRPDLARRDLFLDDRFRDSRPRPVDTARRVRADLLAGAVRDVEDGLRWMLPLLADSSIEECPKLAPGAKILTGRMHSRFVPG
jgi:hypothetical protein